MTTYSSSGGGRSPSSPPFELWPFMSKHPNVKRQLEQLALKASGYFAVGDVILSLHLVDTGPSAALPQSRVEDIFRFIRIRLHLIKGRDFLFDNV